MATSATSCGVWSGGCAAVVASLVLLALVLVLVLVLPAAPERSAPGKRDRETRPT